LPEDDQNLVEIFSDVMYISSKPIIRFKFNSHQPMHFFIQRCISILS